MTKDCYTFGRAQTCDVVFDGNSVKKSYVNIISKLHFKITKEEVIDSDGYKQIVFLHDFSQNGTFINKNKVGKGNKTRLRNDDIIALSEPNKLKVYIFMDEDGLESSEYPNEVTRKYTVSRKLGSGACGEVKMAFSKDTGNKVAIKIIAKKSFTYEDSSTDSKKRLNEIEILKKLKHPCIINMIDFIDTPLHMYIVLQLMEGGELLDRITMNKNLSEKHTKVLFYQVVLAVQYLHQKGIAHRDLKPENILLASHDDETLVKVTDFGLSKLMNSSMLKTFCGTLMYVAPEVLKNNGRAVYTNQVDIWSMGVILYCCLSGLTPFSSKASVPLQDQIIKGIYNFPPRFSDVSSNAVSLIKRMMTVNPIDRIKINDVLLHPWFADRTMNQTVNKIFCQFSSDCVVDLPNVEEELEYGMAKRARISVGED